MKFSKIASVGLVVATFLACVQAGAVMGPGVFPKDMTVCSAFSGKCFYYYDQEDRIRTAQRLVEAVDDNYTLLGIKKIRLGMDPKAEGDAFIKGEEAIADKPVEIRTPYDEAKANLEFLDRVKLYIAKFKDTHFDISGVVPPAWIYMPIEFMKVKTPVLNDKGEVTGVEDKYVINRISSKLFSYFLSEFVPQNASGYAELAIGDEVLEYDGKSIDVAANELSPYISSSSDNFTKTEAVRALFQRMFKFPEKNSAVIKFKTAKGKLLTLQVPWVYYETKRQDQDEFFNQNRYFSTKELKVDWDEVNRKWVQSTSGWLGYVPGELQANLSDTKVYIEPTYKSPVVITGKFTKQVQPGLWKIYGVLQVFSFMQDKVVDSNGNENGFLNVIGEFIKSLKNEQIPLILDLRNNGGGRASYPARLLSIITPKDAIYPGPSNANPITRYMRSVKGVDMIPYLPAEDLSNSIGQDELRRIFEEAISSGKEYTAAYSVGDISADEGVGGYDLPVVALVTPNCISACDMTSMLLKTSGRAVLVGSQTNGTGAGFWGTENLNTEWKDTLAILSTRIPSFLFGSPGGPAGQFVFEDRAEELNLENRPTVADVKYETTIRDVMDGDSGWLNKAAEENDKLSAQMAIHAEKIKQFPITF